MTITQAYRKRQKELMGRANELVPGIATADAKLLVRLAKVANGDPTGESLLWALDTVNAKSGYMKEAGRAAAEDEAHPRASFTMRAAGDTHRSAIVYRITANPKLAGIAGVNVLGDEALAAVRQDPTFRHRSDMRNPAPQEHYLFRNAQNAMLVVVASLVAAQPESAPLISDGI